MNYVSINIMGWKIESCSTVRNRKVFVWDPSVYAHFLKCVSCKPCHESRWPVQSLVFPADQCSSCWYTASSLQTMDGLNQSQSGTWNRCIHVHWPQLICGDNSNGILINVCCIVASIPTRLFFDVAKSGYTRPTRLDSSFCASWWSRWLSALLQKRTPHCRICVLVCLL